MGVFNCEFYRTDVRERKDSLNILNVLVACEESQRVCSEFRRLGHNAYSCDLILCSGGHPEWHILGDALDAIEYGGGTLENGIDVYVDKWDLIIAHPPCTFLSSSGAAWYYHPDDKNLPIEQRRPHPRYPHRAEDREKAVKFFMSFTNNIVDYIAIENPVGIMSTRYRKPDQIVQPYMFGDPFEKKTCLWLKNLPKLEPTNIVEPPPRSRIGAYEHPQHEDRKAIRSKTFPGFAKAMAEQWSKYILNERSDVE